MKRALTFLFLLLASVSVYAAAPTLETNAAADTLRIMDGTSGDSVTANDVWDWDDGGGSSGGDGDVPKDGGGTAKVSTFMTEIVADAMYTIQKNFQFGNGSDATWFSSKNEMVYFEDGFTFEVKSLATLQIGELSGDWGINGSTWSVGPSTTWNIVASGQTPSFLMWDSRLKVRANEYARFFSNSMTEIDIRNSTLAHLSRSSSARFQFGNATDYILKRVIFHSGGSFAPSAAPDEISDILLHRMNNGILAQGSVTIENIEVSSFNLSDVKIQGSAVTLNVLNPVTPITKPLIFSADGTIKENYSVNIHVNDRAGDNLEGALVVVTSFGNIVSNDGGSTFYRVIVDHTSNVFATDVSAGRLELTSAENAALAGVTGAAMFGEWITGQDYTAAAQVASESTDSDGDISEVTVDFKQWIGTSEALHSFSPHTITITLATYEPLTPDAIPINAPISLRFELLPLLSEDNVRVAIQYSESKTGNMTLPIIGDVELTVQYGASGVEFTGTFASPALNKVQFGVQWGAGGIEFSGTLPFPTPPIIWGNQ